MNTMITYNNCHKFHTSTAIFRHDFCGTVSDTRIFLSLTSRISGCTNTLSKQQSNSTKLSSIILQMEQARLHTLQAVKQAHSCRLFTERFTRQSFAAVWRFNAVEILLRVTAVVTITFFSFMSIWQIQILCHLVIMKNTPYGVIHKDPTWNRRQLQYSHAFKLCFFLKRQVNTMFN